MRTPARKHTSSNFSFQARHETWNFGQASDAALLGGAEFGNGSKEALRIGVFGIAEELAHRRFLDLSACIHDDDVIRDFRDHAKIVRDEHDGGADAGFEVAHQIEDLRLNCHVECGGRLIGNQQFRRTGKAMAIMTRCRIPPES